MKMSINVCSVICKLISRLKNGNCNFPEAMVMSSKVLAYEKLGPENVCFFFSVLFLYYFRFKTIEAII